MRRRAVGMFMAVLVAATGCSSKKQLTNSSAKSSLQEAIERDHKQKEMIPVDETAKLLTTDWTFDDYKSYPLNGSDRKAVLFRQLLDTGYVDQKAISVSYNDIAGDYKADYYPVPRGISYGTPRPDHVIYELKIATQAASTKLTVKYNYHDWAPNGQEVMSSTGDATGTLGNDLVSIKYPYGTLPGGDFTVNKSGSLTELAGPSPSGQVKLTGQGKGGEIRTEQYSYLPSTKLTEDKAEKCPGAEDKKCVSLGGYVIDDVTQLLLVTAESAEGQFKWHFEPTDLGLALAPPRLRSGGTGRVSFRKQPDGDWVLVEYYYR